MSFGQPNPGTQYKVFITPRISLREYDVEVDVTDRVFLNGFPSIRQGIDSSDYDIGAFVYSDMTMTCANQDGYFNGPTDSRSIFGYARDLALVRIVFFQDLDMETIVFRGIIDEEATRVIVKTDQIEFRVLSKDSVIRKGELGIADISSDDTIAEALFSVLNSADITAILNLDVSNINPDFNAVISDADPFEGKGRREAVNELLLASNSVMVIDEDDNIIVKPRTEGENEPLKLFGQGDLRGRENIISLDNYNTGLHRMFNVINNNGNIYKNSDSINAYGSRIKNIDMQWLGDDEETAMTNLMNEFKYPKIELEVTVETFLAKELTLLDVVKIDYPLRAHPSSQFLPICGATACGDPNSKTPFIVGSIRIHPTIKFKIIELNHDTKKFHTTLKLRQTGTETNDGMFD